LFHALEYQIRLRDVLKPLERPCKADLIKKVITDNDLQFHWLIATADFEIVDKKNHDALLKMIVDLYVREIQTIYKDLHNEQRVYTENFMMMP